MNRPVEVRLSRTVSAWSLNWLVVTFRSGQPRLLARWTTMYLSREVWFEAIMTFAAPNRLFARRLSRLWHAETIFPRRNPGFWARISASSGC